MFRPRVRVHLWTRLLPALVLAIVGVPGAASATQCSWPNAWSFRSGSGPSARYVQATAYDGARDELVMFGGHDGSSYLNETWVLHAGAWIQKFPANSPSPRSSAGMVYDSANQVVVMHGGYDGSTRPGDTWEWDGTNWTQTVAAGVGPAYSAFGMAYSVAAGTTVLYGGASAGGRGRDTWEYNAGVWTLITDNSPPSYRSNLAMTYSTADNMIYMFGGQAAGSVELNDLWTYDAGTNTWTTVPGSGPSARQNHRMTYDSTCGGIYLFGGEKDGTWYSDLWKFDGTWSVATSPSPCGARELGTLEHVPGARTMLLFGGRGPSGLIDTTWEYGCWIWDREVAVAAQYVDPTHVEVEVRAFHMNLSPLTQDMGMMVVVSLNGSPMDTIEVQSAAPGDGGPGGGGPPPAPSCICNAPCAAFLEDPLAPYCRDYGALPWYGSFRTGCSCIGNFPAVVNPWTTPFPYPAAPGDLIRAELFPLVGSVGESYPGNDFSEVVLGSIADAPTTDDAVGHLQFTVRPNPATSTATVTITAPRAGRAVVALYNVAGQRLLSIADRDLAAGTHRFEVILTDAQEQPLAAGVYFVRIDIGGAQEVRPLVVAR